MLLSHQPQFCSRSLDATTVHKINKVTLESIQCLSSWSTIAPHTVSGEGGSLGAQGTSCYVTPSKRGPNAELSQEPLKTAEPRAKSDRKIKAA